MKFLKHFLSLSLNDGLLFTSCGPKVDANKRTAKSLTVFKLCFFAKSGYHSNIKL